MKNMGHDKKAHRPHERIGVFVSRRQYRRALEVLDQVKGSPGFETKLVGWVEAIS